MESKLNGSYDETLIGEVGHTSDDFKSPPFLSILTKLLDCIEEYKKINVTRQWQRSTWQRNVQRRLRYLKPSTDRFTIDLMSTWLLSNHKTIIMGFNPTKVKVEMSA